MSFEGDVAKCKFSLFGNDSQRGTSPHNLVKEKYDHALTKYAWPAMSLNPDSSDDDGSKTVETFSIAPLHLAITLYNPPHIFSESIS